MLTLWARLGLPFPCPLWGCSPFCLSFLLGDTFYFFASPLLLGWTLASLASSCGFSASGLLEIAAGVSVLPY